MEGKTQRDVGHRTVPAPADPAGLQIARPHRACVASATVQAARDIHSGSYLRQGWLEH